MSEENKKLVREFVEVCQSQHQMERMSEFISTELVNHNPLPGYPPTFEGAKATNEAGIKAFPDMKVIIHDMFAEGDKVSTYKTVVGTHQSEYMGIPATGKKVEIAIMDVFRVADGKLVEHWAIADSMSLMMQLGAMNPPG